MTAQIRPNRLEVNDRFPMLGFSIRADQRDVEAEVALATDIELFKPENKGRRTAANFYSSRETGKLAIPRGEGVFVVPPDILSRFIGGDRLYFGLASGHANNGGLQVDALPRDGSPFVSLRGLTGRTIRRSPARRGAGRPPLFDWAGDAARPGSERPANGANGASPGPNGGGGAQMVASAPRSQIDYDDGFGDLPATPRPSGQPSGPSGQAPAAAQALSAPAVRAMSDTPVAVTPPSVTTMGTVARMAIDAGLLTIGGPLGAFVLALRSAANGLGCSVGFGPQVGAGLGAGGQLGCGIIFAPNNEIGIYGGGEIDIGFITSLSATANVTIVKGGINAFNGWSGALAISGGEGVVGGGAALFDPRGNFVGVSANVGIGAGFSPVDFYVAIQRTWATRVLALAAAAGSPALARPLAQVSMIYTPSDPAQAATALAEFSARQAAWAAGVPNTTFFPHNAICHIEATGSDGNTYLGTGTYIARDLILTAAHVLANKTSLRIRPGRNGSSSIADFTCGPSDWTMHPNYSSSSSDYDLGVIRVGTAKPPGPNFDLHYLNVSQPSPIIVCGYAAASVDPTRQHLDGDMIRELSPNMHTLRYNLQTEGGTSGSAVFYVDVYDDEERQQCVQEWKLVGVHTAAYDGTVNQGCALTPSKIAWIQGRGLSPPAAGFGVEDPLDQIVRPRLPNDQRSRAQRIGGQFGTRIGEALDLGLTPSSVDPLLDKLDPPATAQPLGLRASAMADECWTINWDQVQLIPQPTDQSCWAAAAAMVLGWKQGGRLTADQIATICHRSTAAGLPSDDNAAFAREMGLTAAPSVCWTEDGFRDLIASKGPLWVSQKPTANAPLSFHAIVVTGMYNDGFGTFVRIMDPWDRVVGTPGSPGPHQTSHTTGSQYIMSWKLFSREYEDAIWGKTPVPQILHANGALGKTLNTGQRTPPGFAMARESGSSPARQSAARALSDECWTVNWDGVQLIPQPTDQSCWAAAGAMVLGWKQGGRLTADQIAAICNRSTAAGLPSDDNAAFAREMGLTAAPSVCWTEEGFRGLIASKGPLWVSQKPTANDPLSFHAIVVTGMYNDGTGSFVRVMDPWDRAVGTPGAPGPHRSSHTTGSRYIMSWDLFSREYEDAIWGKTPVPQILHTNGTYGRTLNTGASTPPGFAMSADGAPSPGPGSQVRAIGANPIDTENGERGRVRWSVDQFHYMKHPNDSPPAQPGQARDGERIVLSGWPKAGPQDNEIVADFAIDWKCDGMSLGQVRTSNIGTHDSGERTLEVRGEIADDPQPHAPSGCAALKLVFTYKFGGAEDCSRTAVTEVRLYGDGTYEKASNWTGEGAGAGALSLQSQAMTSHGHGRRLGTQGPPVQVGRVTLSPDSFSGPKHPNDHAPSQPGTQGWNHTTVEQFGPPPTSIDIAWDHDGLSISNVRIANLVPIEQADSRASAVVSAQIFDLADLYHGAAQLRVRLVHNFTNDVDGSPAGSAVVDVTIRGDGSFQTSRDPN